MPYAVAPGRFLETRDGKRLASGQEVRLQDLIVAASEHPERVMAQLVTERVVIKADHVPIKVAGRIGTINPLGKNAITHSTRGILGPRDEVGPHDFDQESLARHVANGRILLDGSSD